MRLIRSTWTRSIKDCKPDLFWTIQAVCAPDFFSETHKGTLVCPTFAVVESCDPLMIYIGIIQTQHTLLLYSNNRNIPNLSLHTG